MVHFYWPGLPDLGGTEVKHKSFTVEEQRKLVLALRKPNPIHFFIDVFQDWAVIVFTYYFIFYFSTVWSYVLGMWVIGTRIHALFVLSHDCQHICSGIGGVKKIWLEDLTSYIIINYWAFVISYKHRKLHILHHNNTSTIKDPELVMWKLASKDNWFDLPASRSKIFRGLGMQLIGLGNDYLVKMVSAYEGASPAPIDYLNFVAPWTIMLSALTYFGGWWFALKVVLVWLASMKFFFIAMFEFRSWLEHMGLPLQSKAWYGVENMDTHRYYLPAWLRWCCPHNIWVHYEHHYDPSVPYYNLGKVREILHPEVPVLSLNQLLDFFAKSPPIKCGVPLKERVVRE